MLRKGFLMLLLAAVLCALFAVATAEDQPLVSISMETTENLLVNRWYPLTITADEAVKGIMVHYGPYTTTSPVNPAAGQITEEICFEVSGTYDVYVEYTTEEMPDLSQGPADIQWAGSSNTISVTAIELGTLSKPNFNAQRMGAGQDQWQSMAPEGTLVIGDMLRLEIIPGTGEGNLAGLGYTADILQQEGDRYNWLGGNEWDPETGYILLSTDKLPAGAYMIEILGRADGYVTSRKVLNISVSEQAASEGYTFEQAGSTYPEWTLHILKSGEIPDYENAGDTPWSADIAGKSDIRIVLNEGVTSIGKNAFANMAGTVRVEFTGTEMPAVDKDAFAGTTAICRYYSEDNSWTTGTAGRSDATWIYLPHYEEEEPGYLPINYGRITEDEAPCWYTVKDDDNTPYRLTIAQARELGYNDLQLFMDEVPSENDQALFAQSDIPWRAYFELGCEGELSIAANAGGSRLELISMDAPLLTVTIDRGEGAAPLIWADFRKGELNYTGDIQELKLQYMSGGEETASRITVNGQIQELNFYGASSGERVFAGDMILTGSIANGYEYGKRQMDIPGVGNGIELDDTQVRTFTAENLTAATVIDAGALQINGQEISSDIRNYRLEYSFVDDIDDEFDRTTLKLWPKAGGAETEIDLLKYKPGYTAADIQYGPDTEVNVHYWDPDTVKDITFNGGEGADGSRTGFARLFTNASVGTITVNCPVDTLEVYQAGERDNGLNIFINSEISSMTHLGMRGSNNRVELGEGGRLTGSISWSKPLSSTRYIQREIIGPCTLAEDGQLRVMSAKEGESLQSILPSDTALSQAANGKNAVMEISENAGALSEEERYTVKDLIGEDEIDTVFDVSVRAYDAQENATTVEYLNDEVRMAVQNNTEGNAYVVRLHEDQNGSLEAKAVSAPSSGDALWFESDRFSKYMIVSGDGESLRDSAWTWTITNGDTLVLSGNGSIPAYTGDYLPPWRRNPDFGIADIRQIVIGSGITGIGENAFAGLTGTVRIDFEGGSRPEMDDAVFDGNADGIICRYYDNTTAPESWNGNCGAGEGKIRWIYLPMRQGLGNPLEVRYRAENGTGKWFVGGRTESYNSNVQISAEQAREITYGERWIVFDAIPENAEDRAVYEDLDTPTWLLFYENTSGSYTLDFSAKKAENLQLVESYSTGLALTVTGPAGGKLPSLVALGCTTLIYNGDIQRAIFRDTGCRTPSVTINGNVEEFAYYDESSNSIFHGEVTVNGTIGKGTVYGKAELEVPGISRNNRKIILDNLGTTGFTNVTQHEPIITLIDDVPDGDGEGTHKESRLNLQGQTASPLDLSLDMFETAYDFYPDRVAFYLEPKDEARAIGITQGATIYDIRAEDYNPDFTPDDIIRGGNTVVYFRNSGTSNKITLNSKPDSVAEGEYEIRSLYLEGCNVEIDCPVRGIMIWQFASDQEPVFAEINSRVNRLEMILNRGGGKIRTGANGQVNSGTWMRGEYRGDRYFGTVGGNTAIVSDGGVKVPTARSGETTMAILPSDKTVTAAAGLTDGSVASINVTDAEKSSLSPEEQQALEAYLGENDMTTENVANVIDVSVGQYEQRDGNLSYVSDIHELASPVEISVSNDTEKEVQLVRLHAENGQVSAEAVSEPTEAGMITFSSDKFSKYALISEAGSGANDISCETVIMQNESLYVRVRPGDNMAGARANLDRNLQGEPDYVLDDWATWTDGEPDDGFQGSISILTEEIACGDYRLRVEFTGSDGSVIGHTEKIIHIVEDPDTAGPRIDLPLALKEIGEEAFAGIPARVVQVPYGAETIGRRAFADSGVELVILPETIREIAPDAFEGSSLRVVYGCNEAAEAFAEAAGVLYFDLWKIGGNG